MNWATATQAERDLAYNNNAAVAEAAALIEERNIASAAMPAPLTLPYGASEREQWELWPEPAAPMLVFIHGGYWQRNRRQDFRCMAEGARAMGWGFGLCGYTLAPDATLSAIVAQIDAALDALPPCGPVVLSGWSAGGHLAAMAAGHPRVAAALPISGIFELGPIRDTYLNEKLTLTDAELATLSPQRLPVVQKPMAVAYGSAELPELCRQSRHFHGLRAEGHAPGPLIPVAGANHFTILDALRRPRGLLLRAAAELLA